VQPITAAQPALLRTRASTVVCFVVLACLAIASLKLPHQSEREIVLVLGLAFSVFIAASIVARTSFLGDRLVFGAAGVALLLSLINQIILPTRSAAAVIHGLKSLAWIVAAVCCGVILVTSWRRRSEKQ